MNYEHLDWEVHDHVATVWLDRPPVNAVNQAMYREIRDLFRDPSQLGPAVRAIVLAGRHRHFCAGNDLEEFVTLDPHNAPGRMREVREAFFAIQDAPVPVIGAVHGAALGTGLAIAASCDVLVASEDAKFGTPEVTVGVMGGARHLMRLVPDPLARWMYFSGEAVAASRMAELGSVIEVVPYDQLLEAAHRRAAAIASHATVVLTYAKRSLNHIEHLDLQPGYAYEQTLTGELSGQPDAKEALAAVMERRAPRFSDD